MQFSNNTFPTFNLIYTMEENQNLVPGHDGGTHVSGTPLTTALTADAAPDLLVNSIDRRIVKVRPMSTPIDQLSRHAGARSASSMTVEYYSVDTKRTETEVISDLDAASVVTDDDGNITISLRTGCDQIFDPSETVLVPGVSGADGQPLVLYTVARRERGVDFSVVNPVMADGVAQVPQITVGCKLVRMGRAAAELDVQTAQFSALPRKQNNNCQIFKMQVEQSTLQKLAGKEVGWTFSDQEEAAIIDMRLGMEKNFVFGAKAKIMDNVKNEPVYLTGGIWSQAGRQFVLRLAKLGEGDMIDLCSAAFTRNAGRKQKLLIAVKRLMESLSRMECTRSITAGDTMVRWGIEFKEIRSNFGSLLVLHSEVFDQCGHESDGLVVDPEYVTKYVHLPFKVEKLDLRRSGQRNTDAVVITEASCLVLRYPDAHMRVIGE